MTALSMTSLGVSGLDPDVNLSGNYNTSTGAYSGSGSTTFQNGFTVNTTLNATFSFDGNQNPQYMDVLIRTHIFNNQMECVENFTTAGSRAVTSGARFKSGIVSLLPDGVTLLGLRPVSFRYRASYGDPSVARIGLIADEVVRVFPGAVALDERGRPAGIWYDRLTGLVGKEIGTRVERRVDAAIVRLAKRL